MQEINVKTGFGYFKDSEGHIVAKCELPIRKHFLQDEYVFVEVKSKKELDKIEIYVPPKTPEEIREAKIRVEMNRILREQAIQNLKAKGEIDG